MKIYVAGPMQGYPNFNFPNFAKATEHLRALGHEVFSPAERDIKEHGDDVSKSSTGNLKDIANLGFSLREALADDTAYICLHATAVALLPGWENSKGAFAEWALAKCLGHKLIYLEYEDFGGSAQ